MDSNPNCLRFLKPVLNQFRHWIWSKSTLTKFLTVGLCTSISETRLCFVPLFFIAFVPVAMAQGIDEFVNEETLELVEKYDKRLRYTPSTVLIYEREDIEKTGALTLAELIERVVGIHVTRSERGSNTNLFVRGFTGSTLVLHNGVEISRVITDLSEISVVDIKRIEVVKGSHYPLYAMTAVTGTINIVTSDTKLDEAAGGVRAGSPATNQVWARRSDAFGKIGYSAYVSRTKSRITEKEIEADRQTMIDELLGTDASLAPRKGFFDASVVDARLTLELDDQWKLHQYLNQRELGTGVGVAQSLDPSGMEQVTRYTGDLQYKGSLGRGAIRTRLVYNRADAEFNDVLLFPPGAFGGQFPEGVMQAYGQKGQELFGEILYRVTSGIHEIEIGVGGSRAEVRNKFDRRNYTVEPGNLFPQPIGEVQDFGDTAPLFSDDYSVSTGHVALRDEWRLTDTLAFHIGARLDHSSDTGTFVNPRLVLDWVAGQYTNVFLLYGESAEPPTEVEQTSNGLFLPLGDDDLKVAKTRILELAFDHDFRNGLSVSSNLFTYRLDDTISVVPDEDAPIGTRFVNLDETERGSGMEVQMNWKASSNLDITVGGAYQQIQSDDLSNAGAPQFQPYAEVNYKPGRGWNVNVTTIGINKRDREQGDDREPIDDYNIVNITALKRDAGLSGLDLSLSIQNAFESDAREDISSAIPNDLPVYPRRFLLSATYGW